MCNNAGITRERRGKERKRMKERSKNESTRRPLARSLGIVSPKSHRAIFASADFSRTPWELDRARNDRTKIGPRSCCCCYYFSFFFFAAEAGCIEAPTRFSQDERNRERRVEARLGAEEGASGSWYSRTVFLVRQYRYPFIPE